MMQRRVHVIGYDASAYSLNLHQLIIMAQLVVAEHSLGWLELLHACRRRHSNTASLFMWVGMAVCAFTLWFRCS